MGKALYNPNDRLTGRDGGPYLDQVQAREAEVIRAAKEDREPDFDKVPADAGIQLSTAAQLLKAVDVNQPSAFHTTESELERSFAASVDDDNTLLQQYSEIPDEVFKSKSELEDENSELLVDKDEEVVEVAPSDPNASPGTDVLPHDEDVEDNGDHEVDTDADADADATPVPTPDTFSPYDPTTLDATDPGDNK